MLAPHLAEANQRDLLERARHKTKREVELLMATVNPQPDVPSTVRKLPALVASLSRPEEPATPDVSPSLAIQPSLPPAPRPAEIKPIAPERYKIQFTVSRETYEKLRQVQNLLRHAVPNGDPAVIFEKALTLNTIMSCPLRREVTPQQVISSCGVAHTTNMRRTCGSARRKGRRCEKSARCLAREPNSFQNELARGLRVFVVTDCS